MLRLTRIGDPFMQAQTLADLVRELMVSIADAEGKGISRLTDMGGYEGVPARPVADRAYILELALECSTAVAHLTPKA